MTDQLLHVVHVLESLIGALLLLFGTSCAVLWREEIVRARASNQKPTGTIFAIFSWAFFVAALIIFSH